MQKQPSLLNFFKKSPSTDTVIKKNINPSKPDDSMTTEATLSQEAPLASNSSNSVAPKAVLNQSQSPITDNNDEEDEEVVQKKLYKRLKKCVRIADDDDEEYQPPKEAPALSTNKKVAKSGSIEIEYESARKAPASKSTTPIKTPSGKGKENSQSTTSTTAKKTTTAKKNNKTPSVTPSKGAIQEEEEGGEGEVLIDIGKNEGNAFDYNDFTDSTPDWAKPENAKDAKKRTPDDPQYDPTTLFIPPGALEKLTPTMKQYWNIKCQNFDKIILFKLGKFYELFYEDALICHRELDLNWMANKMHVGFPEKALERYAPILVNRGYKVCVVEQTETPKQMEARLKTQSGKKEKVVKREMVQVMSKGTCINSTDVDSEPKILLALRCRRNLISVAFLEVGANIITTGSFTDDENFTQFKTFVSQVRPVEVIYETIETHPTIIRIIRNCSTNPILSPMNDPMAWNVMKAYAELEASYGSKDKWPEGLNEVLKMDESEKDQVMLSICGLICYLKKMLIADNVLHAARFDFYDPKKFQISRMVLDSQALQHLEILEVNYATKSSVEGSLLHFVDKTVSAFGKRLLRKWVCAPLLDVDAINDRLDALEDLESLYEEKANFRKSLQQLPDLERVCGRVYNQSIKKNSNVILFEDIAGSRLREFKKLLESLRKARNIMNAFSGCQIKSKFLQKLVTFVDHDTFLEQRTTGGMPEILPLLDQMATFVVWEGPKQETPVPKPGLDKDYDGYKQQIQEIEEELEEYLKTIKAKFNGNKDICYAHTKHRYEIEIPTKLVSGNKKPSDFEFSSKKSDRERFITKYIKDKVEELEEVEEKMKFTLNGFVCFVFNYFYKHHKVWDRFIEGLAQLDCLCSLSMVSFLSDGNMCRPELYPANERVFMDVRDMRHPCVSMNKSNFVSNDIIIGDLQQSEANKGLMLLTGPNMGGKSTILRQACIAAVMAQLGCYVPATSCRLSLVDRIFTRIGASDKLSEGKSTFFIEMEETVNVLKYGTMNSLAIMDELGRGTSTFDGVAIAYSVVNYIISKLGCRTLFATHYHVLLDEFKENPHISFYHMASRIENDRVVFLYKLIQGECSNSFGLNIAKLSGINKDIVNVAKEKADEFEKNLNIREAVRLTKAFNRVLKELESDQNVDEKIDFICEALECLKVDAQ